jgi:hypothetical protein
LTELEPDSGMLDFVTRAVLLDSQFDSHLLAPPGF